MLTIVKIFPHLIQLFGRLLWSVWTAVREIFVKFCRFVGNGVFHWSCRAVAESIKSFRCCGRKT